MKLPRQLRALFRREKLDAEMSEEMRVHLELQVDENIRRGLSPDEARDAALRGFGGVEQIKERARDERRRGLLWLDHLLQDLRYGGRQLRRDLRFTSTAVATLALGIGATTAIFSVVNGLMLKPLPYEQPGQLVQIFEAPTPGAQNAVSPGAYFDWRRESTLCESFAAFRSIDLNLTGNGEPERLNGLRVTADALTLLRAQPLLGRVFAPDEDQEGKDKVVVLTHALWQRRFAGDPAIVNQTVSLNGEPYTVLGVLPPGFLPFGNAEFVVPYVFPAEWTNLRAAHFLAVYARMKPGVAIAEARAELQAIAQRTRALHPAWKREWSITLVPLKETLSQAVRPALLVLLGAVVLVLLIACVNVANLLLARASTRAKEIALRAALGASRGRIIRQLLVESVLLSLLGTALGLLLAVWFVDGLRHVTIAMQVPRAHEVALEGRVLIVALVTTVVTGLGFGLAPALHASRAQLTDALKDAARGSAGRGGRLRGGLIVAEVALALVLLVGAGLMLRSFFRVMNEPAGFVTRGAVAMELSLPLQQYPHNAQRAALQQRLLERVAAIPGVEAAGVSNALSLRGATPDLFFEIVGRKNPPASGYNAEELYCTPDYFRAMGIPLRRGRAFGPRDAEGPRVALISESMARAYFPGEDPIGRHLNDPRNSDRNRTWEIVGIVGDVRTRGLTAPFRPIVYRLQSAQEASRNSHLIVRSSLAPMAVVASVRQALREIDPALPIAAVQTLDELVEASVAERRLTLVLLALFAGAALALAAIGLYGVIAYSVAQRTREIGIRLALGATRQSVLGLVLGQGLRLTLLGLALGIAGALGLGRLLSALLYEVQPTDPVTFLAVPAVLLGVATVAAWLPARRAARVDPMIALRAE